MIRSNVIVASAIIAIHAIAGIDYALTIYALVPVDTRASVSVHLIMTSGAILARIRSTLVDLCTTAGTSVSCGTSTNTG